MFRTVEQCLKKESQLTHSDSARLDVELLLCHVLHKDRTYLYTWPEKRLSEEQLRQFEQLFQQRLDGSPIAHLLQQREFWTLSLEVSDATLIPRPDTELLVEAALQLDLPAQARLLDLGTGTGAIALALASEKADWLLTAVDSSEGAVQLAERNRQRLGFDHVNVQASDWFAGVENTGFHAIVSNPPYIAAEDPHLQQGDVRFEPHSALVADRDGLADLEHIIEHSREFLLPGGWILLEHGHLQGESVRKTLMQAGYVEVSTLQDYGNNDRVSLGQWNG